MAGISLEGVKDIPVQFVREWAAARDDFFENDFYSFITNNLIFDWMCECQQKEEDNGNKD